MEMEARGIDDMDLLKDITRGLRGSGETARNERGRTAEDSRSDPDRRSTTSRSDAPGSADESGDVESSDGGRGDVHVCSFCETEFDASRDVCPECDAEIVFRGTR
jgi:hypothetical protein